MIVEGMNWIKLNSSIFEDTKIRYIRTLPAGDSLVIIWLQLLCLAGRECPDGVLVMNGHVPYTVELLSSFFAEPLNTVKLAVETFLRLGMIEVTNGIITIVNWAKHQNISGYLKQRAATKERVRKFRERQKAITDTSTNSSENRTCNALRNGAVTSLEEEVEKEVEEEKKESPSSAAGKTIKGTETIRFYERNIHPISSVYERDTLLDMADEFGDEWCVEAIKESITYNKRSLKYINTVLNRWKEDGFKSDSRRNPRQHSTITKEQEMEIDQYVNF